MRSFEEFEQQIESNQRKLLLCKMVVDEVNQELLSPLRVEERADLLIATEELAESTMELLMNVREMVWGKNNPTSNSDL